MEFQEFFVSVHKHGSFYFGTKGLGWVEAVDVCKSLRKSYTKKGGYTVYLHDQYKLFNLDRSLNEKCTGRKRVPKGYGTLVDFVMGKRCKQY